MKPLRIVWQCKEWKRAGKTLYSDLLSLKTGVLAQNPIVRVLPDALFTTNGGVHDVLEGSVIQLYCTATSSTTSPPTIAWMRDSTELTNDPAHLRIRTSSSGTTSSSVLTIDSFQDPDNGEYHCVASDSEGQTTQSPTLTLTGKWNY